MEKIGGGVKKNSHLPQRNGVIPLTSGFFLGEEKIPKRVASKRHFFLLSILLRFCKTNNDKSRRIDRVEAIKKVYEKYRTPTELGILPAN